MFKTIVIVLVVLVAAVLVYAATKPDTFRIERTASIKAPPEKLFAIINDLHNWDAWSPYEKLDPSMKKTHQRRRERQRCRVRVGRQQQGRCRAHGDRGVVSTFSGQDEAGFPQTVRGS